MDHVQRVLTAMEPLCEPLYDAVTSASSTARERHPEFTDSDEFAPILTHVARGLTLAHLRSSDLGDWRTNRLNNVGIELRRDSISLRLLHGLPDRSAPPPGSNLSRRQFYCNPTLNDDLLPPAEKLLAIWSVNEVGAVSIRVVRPTGIWRYGKRERVDLDFLLPQEAADLQNLVFEPTDEDIEVEIPREEDAGGAEHGLSG